MRGKGACVAGDVWRGEACMAGGSWPGACMAGGASYWNAFLFGNNVTFNLVETLHIEENMKTKTTSPALVQSERVFMKNEGTFLSLWSGR